MLKKIIGLGLVLTFACISVAYAQKTEVITGTIKSVLPAVVEGKSEILLNLEGRAETFLVLTADAPKFGLMKSETVSSGAEFEKMLDDLDKARGWKVKLTCVKSTKPLGPEYLVKSLEKLSGK